MTGTTFQDANAVSDELLGPVRYKRAVFRHLQNVMYRAKARLTAATQNYEASFDRKVLYHQVINSLDFVFVDRQSRILRKRSEHTVEGNLDRSSKLLPRSESL